MTATLSCEFDGAQRAPDSTCNRTSAVANSKTQQFHPPARPHYTYPTVNSIARKRTSKPSNSSSSSSRWGVRHPPTTDPVYITQLWQNVMACGDGGQSSKERGKAPKTLSTIDTQTSVSASVSDSDLETSVLTPYGITIRENTLTQSFYDHFSLYKLLEDSKLVEDRTERFKLYKAKLPLDVWLEPNEENATRIQQEYRLMKEYQCNEVEFSAYALHTLFLDEPRYPSIFQRSDSRLAPVRMLQLVQKPSSDTSKWKAPPRIDLSEKQYDWDIRPDCAYYVSLQAFPGLLRFDIRTYVSVVQGRAFCSYLSIGFKKDQEAPRTVISRVAIDSTIALYNRWCLKRSMLETINKQNNWPEEDKHQLRHYCIVFIGSAWELWYTTPKTYDDGWSGCTMSKMKNGDCCDLESVKLLLSILNDIHYWGLTVHGVSCQTDIETIIEGQTGRILGLPEEIEKPRDFGVGTT
ncbi:hypothetical protein O1611_g5818 [Lasiodiplodia mahajangana]|uniref:Uncharacterized protein n=1 Tax=Lasiodiplodia mahajangana TaxID=1108764 RepID=A0ACC2JK59_9PEZI|nr:hypothetical protein O1611_g5818 [Lasiodiplodia mahajangana]